MSWSIIIAVSLLCFALKSSGFFMPASLNDNQAVAEIVDIVPVILLGGLIAQQVFARGQAIEVDARFGAFVVAAACVRLGAPFLVVVFASALCAAVLRFY